MSVLFCTACDCVIDPQEDDYTTDSETGEPYCDDCYKQSPEYCASHFTRGGTCVCGEHIVDHLTGLELR